MTLFIQRTIILAALALNPAVYGNTNGLFREITRDGITWRFDQPVQAGKFVSGDWWVVPNPGQDAVTVVSVEPAPTNTSVGKLINGSMVNPVPGYQAMDERGAVWKAEVGCHYPLVLKVNQSLLSVRSVPEDDSKSKKTSNKTWVYEDEVLTCLAQPALATDFRPPYVGADKPLYSSLKLRRELLPDLAPPGKVEMPDMKALTAARFSHPWMQFMIGYLNAQMAPVKYESSYGYNKSTEVGAAALLLCLDKKVVGDKDPLLIGLVQHGIDLYHTLTNGGNWQANGGFNSGRKFPILFAGLMLNNPAMLDIGTKYPLDSYTFAEDAQSFIISQAEVDRKFLITGQVLSAGPTTIGVGGKSAAEPDGVPPMNRFVSYRIKIISGPGEGQVRMISMSDAGFQAHPKPLITCTIEPPWGVLPEAHKSVYQILGFQKEDIGKAWFCCPGYIAKVKWLSPVIIRGGLPGLGNPALAADPTWEGAYSVLNRSSWPGMVLAARILGLKEVWKHEPLFQLEDEYMKETAPGGAYYGKEKFGTHRLSQLKPSNDPNDLQFTVSGAFTAAMWDLYRPQADQLGAEIAAKAKSP